MSYGYITRSVNLELTDKCQAGCPECSRTIIKDAVGSNELTLKDIQVILPKDDFHHFDQIVLCGNLGDPLVCKDIREIVEYFSDLKVKIHTNGSLRSVSWWKSFGEYCSKHNVHVHFGLDGASQETHVRYRVNTSYDKILKNAQTFIDAGGECTWEFIRFDWNEHEVDEARLIATDMGFSGFRYYDNERNTKKVAETPKHIPNKDKRTICRSKNNLQSVYIDCEGYFYPCCWTAIIAYHHRKSLPPRRYEDDHVWVENMDHEKLNLKKYSISQVLNSSELEPLEVVQDDDSLDTMCRAKCGGCK